MKYLALIYGNRDIWYGQPRERRDAIIAAVDAFNARLRESGELVGVDGLLDPARSVRMADGVPVVSDGPYLEAKEHVGSYFIVDVESEARALRSSAPIRGSGRVAGSSCGPS